MNIEINVFYNQIKISVLMGLVWLACGCNARSAVSQSLTMDQICKNDTTLYTYLNQEQTKLSGHFLPFDEQGKPMNLTDFWKQLSLGGYLPFRVTGDLRQLKYQLSPLPLDLSASMRAIVLEWGGRHAHFYEMEGKVLPDFSFTDLDGNLYNSSTMHGKVVVLKCWFIACPNCVEEIPQLNQLRSNYQNDKDIVFVSLALDNDAELRAFLKRVPFSYAVVPGQNDYLLNTLKISLYPTHLILDRQGRIIRFLDTGEEVSDVLRQVLSHKDTPDTAIAELPGSHQ